MPITAFLKLDDIAGESRNAEHEEEIDIHALQWVVAQSTASSSNRRRSRAEVDDLVLHKFYDAASPYLFIACKRGKTFKEATIAVQRLSSDGMQNDYLVITMTNVVINSVEMLNNDTSPDDRIHEVITLGCETATTTYVEIDDMGAAGQEHSIAFNVIAPS